MKLKHVFIGVTACVLLTGPAGSPAAAGDQEDCTVLLDNKDAAIAACSRLIGSGLTGRALATVYATRGNLHRFYKNERDRALADYTAAIHADPKFADAYYSRGTLHDTETKDYDRAIADFSEAIRLDPKHANAYWRRGETYVVKKDYDRAIADHGAAIRLEPSNASHWFYRGSVYHWHKEDYDRAIADMSDAIRLKPDDATYHLVRGRSYEKKGQLDQALANFRTALSLDPDRASIRESIQRVEAAGGGTKLAAVPPAATPTPAAPAVAAPSATPVSAKQLLERYALIGIWAPDCSKPVSAQNKYLVFRPVDEQRVQIDSMDGPTSSSGAYVARSAVESKPREITLDVTGPSGQATLPIRLEGDYLGALQAWHHKCR